MKASCTRPVACSVWSGRSRRIRTSASLRNSVYTSGKSCSAVRPRSAIEAADRIDAPVVGGEAGSTRSGSELGMVNYLEVMEAGVDRYYSKLRNRDRQMDDARQK